MVTLTLEEIRMVIEDHRPPERPDEHDSGGIYFFENGQRDMCDKLLEFFSEE